MPALLSSGKGLLVEDITMMGACVRDHMGREQALSFYNNLFSRELIHSSETRHTLRENIIHSWGWRLLEVAFHHLTISTMGTRLPAHDILKPSPNHGNFESTTSLRKRELLGSLHSLFASIYNDVVSVHVVNKVHKCQQELHKDFNAWSMKTEASPSDQSVLFCFNPCLSFQGMGFWLARLDNCCRSLCVCESLSLWWGM